MITANSGGWSELYISGVGVGEGRIPLADENMKEIGGAGIEVLGVRRHGSDLTCWRNCRAGRLELRDAKGTLIHSTPLKHFKRDMRQLLRDIERKRGRTFASQAGRRVMAALGYTQVQAGARNKADLEFVVRNQFTGRPENVRYSAKSMIFSMPTILNSSRATTARMTLQGLTCRRARMAFKKAKGTIGRVAAAKKIGGRVVPREFLDPVFLENLRMVDDACPIILLHLIKHYVTGAGARFSTLVDAFMRDKETVRKHRLTRALVTDKVCRLLAAAALGMTPGTRWDGTHGASGGMLVLGGAGKVYLLSFENREQLHRFLLENTKLDCPSPKRFPSGDIVQVGGRTMVDLNFQIRWAGGATRRRAGGKICRTIAN